MTLYKLLKKVSAMSSPINTGLKYNEARSVIKSGDLIAFTHRPWKSWYDIKLQLIRLFTRSEYVHIGIAWTVGGRIFILEAVSSGIRIYPLSKSGEFYLISSQKYWSVAAESYALSKVGEPYSQLAAIAALAVPVRPDQVNECAAYVISVSRLTKRDLGDIATPSAVVQRALEAGASITYVNNSKE